MTNEEVKTVETGVEAVEEIACTTKVNGVGLATIGLGIAGVGVALYFGVKALKRKHDAKKGTVENNQEVVDSEEEVEEA